MEKKKSCSSERINIAASVQRIDVDNRIALRYYYRIADNILKQADIFRAEKNIIDLYIMLLRFSSLVSETIPCHREYRASLQNEKLHLKKKLLIAVNELEELKPAVQQKINELNRKYEVNGRGHFHQNNSLEWPPVRKPMFTNNDVTKAARPVTVGRRSVAATTYTLSEMGDRLLQADSDMSSELKAKEDLQFELNVVRGQKIIVEKQLSKAMAQMELKVESAKARGRTEGVAAYKASDEYRTELYTFSAKSYRAGFNLCKEEVRKKFPEIDLSGVDADNHC